MSKFPCEMCGSCCKSIGKLVIGCQCACNEATEDKPVHDIVIDIAEFPYTVNQDGSCPQLDPGGFCKIYETRPFVCRTDEMFDRYWSKIMTREEWYAQSRKSCEKLQKATLGNKLGMGDPLK